jgi:ketosteroid isomerase-like protein
MRRRLLGLVTIAALYACNAGGGKNTASNAADVRHVIDSLNARIAAAISTGQIDSVADVYATDIWQMPPNQPPLVGHDSVVSFWRGAVATGKWEFDLKSDDVLHSDSLAVERGHFTLKVTAGPKAQYPSFEDHGNYVVAWRRDSDGHWRAVWDAPVSTVPMPMPTTPAKPAKKT